MSDIDNNKNYDSTVEWHALEGEYKGKPGNPLAKYHRKKELTPIEQLEYKVALLERELLKKDAEVVRLKKSIELERGDAKRK